MKFLHLSDLHIGKRLKEFSLLEDQTYILQRILDIVDDECPNAVLIAGDVYDKSVPSGEAVGVFDEFLCRLVSRGVKTFIVSGNHDSSERLAFGGRIMEKGGVYLSPVYDGNVSPVVLEDEQGEVCLYLLPFIKPVHVRSAFPEETIDSYTGALEVAIREMHLDESKRNVLVAHQFVTGASRTDSEEVSVGGTDNVDARVFAPFDYVALGHIHRAQNCGDPRVRYCGTPLKYSFSEAKDEKSVTVVELGAKGDLTVREVPLKPLREMRELKGTYDELTRLSFYENTTYDKDYVRVILTDENDILDAMGKLRVIYKNLMGLEYDNTRTRTSAEDLTAREVENKSPIELFAEFYAQQNGNPMCEEQTSFVRSLIEEIWEGEE